MELYKMFLSEFLRTHYAYFTPDQNKLNEAGHSNLRVMYIRTTGPVFLRNKFEFISLRGEIGSLYSMYKYKRYSSR